MKVLGYVYAHLCVWIDKKTKGLQQKQVPWCRWLTLMLSDSTEQIIIKHTLSLSLHVQCKAATQSSDARGRTEPVRALSWCTVSVNIRNMLPVAPLPLWAQFSISVQSLTNPRYFSPLDAFISVHARVSSSVYFKYTRYTVYCSKRFLFCFMGCCWGTFFGIREEFPLLCSYWNVWLWGISNSEQAVKMQRLTHWLLEY